MPSVDQIAYQMAAKLAPPGSLATRIGSKLRRLWEAAAEELARIYGRVEDLLREVHPETTDELLADWETEYDLPDPCVATAQSESDRRGALLSRIGGVGSQSRQYFKDIAASIGISITITEHRAFLIGRDGMGDPIGGSQSSFTWEVVASAATSQSLRDIMECTFARLKPAHTVVFFTYV